MELKKTKKEDVYFNSRGFTHITEEEKSAFNYVKSIVSPIFKQSLKELSKNHMMVGGMVPEKVKYCLYQPHNYRLYIDFKKPQYTNFPFINTMVKSMVEEKKPLFPMELKKTEYKLINKSEHSFKNYKNCNIRVKKTQIELINKINSDKWFKIDISENAEAQILEIIKQKDKESLKVLKEFIKNFGGSSSYTILNRHSENKIMGEDSINLIPIKEKFYNKVVKKVYNENNIEFSDPALASNFIVNRAIENIAPTLAKQMEELRGEVLGVMGDFSENIKTHLTVLKGIEKSFDRFNNLLDKSSYVVQTKESCLTIQQKHLRELEEEIEQGFF